MEYKVVITFNDRKRVRLSENNSSYGLLPIYRGDFWELLSDLDKGKIKSFCVSLDK